MKIERLSRVLVDLILHPPDFLRGDAFKTAALREVLPDKPVEVLHPAFFPGVVGRAEVTLRIEGVADFRMT